MSGRTVRRLVNKHAASPHDVRELGAALADVYEADLDTHRLVAVPNFDPETQRCVVVDVCTTRGGRRAEYDDRSEQYVLCPDCEGRGVRWTA